MWLEEGWAEELLLGCWLLENFPVTESRKGETWTSRIPTKAFAELAFLNFFENGDFSQE